MPNFKDTQNNLHFLDSAEFEYLLPTGSVPITGEEASTLQEPVPTPEQLREIAKQARAAAVERITVTVGDKVFDGNEISQTRMARAIVGMQAASVPTITWVLANNTVTEATVAELTEAMILAGQAQAAVWVIP